MLPEDYSDNTDYESSLDDSEGQRSPRQPPETPQTPTNRKSHGEIMKLINNIFICNYWDKRQGHGTLIDSKQIIQWINYFENVNFEAIPHMVVGPYMESPFRAASSFMISIGNLIQEKYKLIHDILILGNGRISLCGGAIINLLSYGSNLTDWDLFFHCDAVEEAVHLLNLCMNFINDNHEPKCTYSRNSYVQSVKYRKITIQFILRAYKTKDQILLGFDLAGSRIGYNPYDGIFATICGGLSIAMKGFPLDLTQRSTSFGYRIEKYSRKGFKIIIPGIPKSFNGNIQTPDGLLRIQTENVLSKNNRKNQIIRIMII